MDTKLTLKIDESIIEKAKQYAKDKNISLSKMIENYLQAVTNKKSDDMEISPLVESLIGVISSTETDKRKDYTDYLSKKYD